MITNERHATTPKPWGLRDHGTTPHRDSAQRPTRPAELERSPRPNGPHRPHRRRSGSTPVHHGSLVAVEPDAHALQPVRGLSRYRAASRRHRPPRRRTRRSHRRALSSRRRQLRSGGRHATADTRSRTRSYQQASSRGLRCPAPLTSWDPTNTNRASRDFAEALPRLRTRQRRDRRTGPRCRLPLGHRGVHPGRSPSRLRHFEDQPVAVRLCGPHSEAGANPGFRSNPYTTSQDATLPLPKKNQLRTRFLTEVLSGWFVS